jgi:hypothetical protein
MRELSLLLSFCVKINISKFQLDSVEKEPLCGTTVNFYLFIFYFILFILFIYVFIYVFIYFIYLFIYL